MVLVGLPASLCGRQMDRQDDDAREGEVELRCGVVCFL